MMTYPDTAVNRGGRAWAVALSYVLHPIFIPIYVTAFLLYIHPLMFAGYSDLAKLRLLATIFVNLTMLPAITVFLCWRLKFIGNMHMRTQKERIIPLAAAMIFYFWCWFVLKNFSSIPLPFREFLLGSFLTVIGGWLANIYFKVSLHALAVGGMAIFMLLIVFNYEGGSAWHPAAALVAAGGVCSARLNLMEHAAAEIYIGVLIGALAQVVALWV